MRDVGCLIAYGGETCRAPVGPRVPTGCAHKGVRPGRPPDLRVLCKNLHSYVKNGCLRGGEVARRPGNPDIAITRTGDVRSPRGRHRRRDIWSAARTGRGWNRGKKQTPFSSVCDTTKPRMPQEVRPPMMPANRSPAHRKNSIVKVPSTPPRHEWAPDAGSIRPCAFDVPPQWGMLLGLMFGNGCNGLVPWAAPTATFSPGARRQAGRSGDGATDRTERISHCLEQLTCH